MESNSGDGIIADNANWRFSGKMVDSFDNHVSKSVPLYNEGHDLIVKLSDFFVSNGSMVYELGSSTAELTLKLAIRNKNKDVIFRAIEIEEDMHRKASEKTKNFQNIQLINESLLTVELEKCDMVVSYYTIQFIKPSIRQDIFNRIYESLNWGGAFVLFEKVRAPDARFQDITTSLYNDFKLDNGYSPDEIVSKSRSLKGVLEPFSTAGNIDIMKRAGFVDIMSVIKYVSFEGFLAIK